MNKPKKKQTQSNQSPNSLHTIKVRLTELNHIERIIRHTPIGVTSPSKADVIADLIFRSGATDKNYLVASATLTRASQYILEAVYNTLEGDPVDANFARKFHNLTDTELVNAFLEEQKARSKKK